MKQPDQREHWENAGQIGYENAMYSSPLISKHITSKHWQAAIRVAKQIGIHEGSKVLELGCGDGVFANHVLSQIYQRVDAYDVSTSAIKRAQSQNKNQNVFFHVKDLTGNSYNEDDFWDGAFLMGFLHHVKVSIPKIVHDLSKVAPKLVVVEPNGNNPIRKILETLPSYKKAGEDSLRMSQLIKIFEENGYEKVVMLRSTFVPPFLPPKLFPVFKQIEKIIESVFLLNRLCSTNIIGFKHRKNLSRIR